MTSPVVHPPGSGGDPRVGAYVMMRDAGAIVRSWVDHYLSLGFERLYLFFDDPDEDDWKLVADESAVTVVRVTDSVRDEWRNLPVWEQFGPHVETEVLARQGLNASLALRHAEDDGLDWLLQVDQDELLVSAMPIAELFGMDFDGTRPDVISFRNHEGVPRSEDIHDYLREVTLFKRNPWVLNSAHIDHTALWPADRPYFISYIDVKSAARLGRGLVAFGPHRFRKADLTDSVQVTLESGVALLHDTDAGFEHYWRKYELSGRFADGWFGRFDTADQAAHRDMAMADNFPHRLDSRDAVMAGDRERAHQLYRQNVMLDDQELIDRLIQAGILFEFDPFDPPR